MDKAVLPFVEYMFLQIAVMIVGLNVHRENELGVSGVTKAWIFGQMLCFAVLQIMAVPMILVRFKFDVLFWTYVGIISVLFGLGLWRLIKGKTVIRIRVPELRPLELMLLLITVLLILWQSGVYFFGMHLDEDDARWLAEANDALEYGHMMTRNYDTGEYVGFVEVAKDVAAPWPMMIAILSRLLNTRTAVFSHTIYASVELLLLYSIYWLIGKELFEKKESRLTFFFFVTLINLFFGRTVYTQSTFSLVRIWQGKATVAGVIVPLLFYLFLCINKHDMTKDWRMLPIICCAACLMSGMGLSISAIMIAVYGAYNILVFRKWKRIPLVVLAIAPAVIFLLVYTSHKALL